MPNNQIKSLTVDGVTYDIVDETSGYMKGMTILSYGSSTWQDFITAYNEQKVVYCRASSQANPASGEQTRLAFMAYVNDADTPTSVEFQYYRSVSTHTESQQGDQVFVYTLTSTGNWSVTTREASAKTSIGSNKEIETAYSNGVITIGHPDGYASTMTQAVYPITISPYGHIASYGNAITIPTISIDRKVTTGVNIADITINGTTTELYAPTGGGGSVESVAVSNATNGGLSVSGSPITSSGTITIGHSNVLTSAQTTQAVYPIKIDKNGHISAYGSAVTIPTTAADVGAVPTTRTVNGKTLSSDITLSASDVSALPSSTTIPTKTSDLTNDSGFVTTDEKLKTTALSSGTSYLIMGSTSGTAETKLHSTHLSFTSTRTFSIGSSGNKGTLRLYSSTSSSYTDLSNSATAARTITIPDATGTLALTSDIPTVPTNVSAFTNDAGYLTSYTETDPTVPSWAKASTKPTYTASEVGAAATSHAHGNITSGGDITATAPTIANGDQIVINDSSASKITNGPTFDGSTTNKYLSPKGTWESLPQGTAYTAGTGLSLSGTEFNHSNSITATATAGVYPIEIDAQGHISYYGDAVNIDNFVENYNGENISGYIATVTSDGCGVLRYRDQRFSEDNTAQIQYGTASNNTSSFISLDANDINIWGNINAESNKIINLGTPTANTDAATKGYVDSNIPSSAASSTTGVSISNHSTSSVTGVQSSTTTASKVTLGTAISVPNVTATGSGSFTQGSFSGGSLTFAIDSTDNKQLNITFTAATHGADSHTHTAPTLGTAISVPNVTAATDVTVPIKDTAATTVVTSATHTVTDNGHTHSLS